MKLSIDDACYGNFFQRIPNTRVPDVFFQQGLMMLRDIHSEIRRDSQFGKARTIEYIELVRCRMICGDGMRVTAFVFNVVVKVEVMDIAVKREFEVRINDDDPKNMNFIRDAAHKVYEQVVAQMRKLSRDLTTVGSRVSEKESV